jgi:flagellar protein FlgJ
MEISGFGMINNMDDLRFSHNIRAPQNFADILERTRNSDRESPVGRGDGTNKDDKLYELCLELETFLIKNLLNSMRNTIQKTGLVDDSFAGKMYEDMLWDEYAKDFTRNAGFGLAEQAYRQLRGL